MFRFSLCIVAIVLVPVLANGEEQKKPPAPIGSWTMRNGEHLIALTISEKSLTWGGHTTGNGSAEITVKGYLISPDNLLYGFISSMTWDNKQKSIGKKPHPIYFRFKLDNDELHVSEVGGPFDKDGAAALAGIYQRSHYTK